MPLEVPVFLRRAIPRGAALGAAVATVLVGLIAHLFALALALSDTPGVAQHGLSGELAWSSAVCASPVWIGGFGFAALLERRPLARSILLLAAALGCVFAGVAISAGQLLDGEEAGLVLFSGLLCGATPAFALLGMAGLTANRWRGMLRDGRDPDALEVAQDELEREGHILPARLETLSGLNAARSARTLQRIALDDPEGHLLDEASGALLRRAHLDAARGRLPGVLAAHAELSLTQLAAELEVPEGQLRELLYAAFAADELHGATVNWKRGVIRTTQAQAGSPCPSCGAGLQVVGKGTLECGHCGTEVFV